MAKKKRKKGVGKESVWPEVEFGSAFPQAIFVHARRHSREGAALKGGAVREREEKAAVGLAKLKDPRRPDS